jgi:hypothetical protein
VVLICSRTFDKFWESSSSIALTDLNDVYSPPLEYDDVKKVNLKFLPPDKVCIEANLRFKVLNSPRGFDYYDTAAIVFPAEKFENVNRIFVQFENSRGLDSIYLVASKSELKDVYFKQVFLSSVIVKQLNSFSTSPNSFRIDNSKLVSRELLENNDTLINQVVNYFNHNMDTLKLAECGRNSFVLQNICSIYKLPCRMLYMQGGDAEVAGYMDQIGYPTHVVCEVYSSRFQKWYVIDPTYGLRFREEGTKDFISAVEISNKFYFQREKELVQDSILATKRSTLGRDYFKYYENIYYDIGFKPNYFLEKFIQYFFAGFNYWAIVYANNTPMVKNAKNYLILKSVMYLLLSICLANYYLIILTKRLIQSKKPKKAATKV